MSPAKYDSEEDVVRLPVGSNPRPVGRGWFLVDYSWNEKTGVARLKYRNRFIPKKVEVVEVEQPASAAQVGWTNRPPIDRRAVLARHHETIRHQALMADLSVYGR